MQAKKDAAAGSQVLVQVDADDTDDRFPVAVADTPSLGDLRLSVKCRLVSGKVDRACGLVFRYQDENNYYVTRANAVENNVRIYHVTNGRRKQLASFAGPVPASAWHDLRVDAKGDRFDVYWNGKKVLTASDETFADAGRVGVWTKADSVTEFDDLSVTPLP